MISGMIVLNKRLLDTVGAEFEVTLYQGRRSVVMAVQGCRNVKPGDDGFYKGSLVVHLTVGANPSCKRDDKICGLDSLWQSNCAPETQHVFAAPFEGARSWLFHEPFWPEPYDAVKARLVDRDAAPQELARLSKQMTDIAMNAAHRVEALCDATILRRARCLASDIQGFGYFMMAKDTRRYVSQLIDICPGVLSLAAIADHASERTAWLCEEMLAGQKLADLIELALPLTLAQVEPVHSLHPSAAALLRRAPALSAANLVALLRAPGIDINDMPRDASAALQWCHAMAAWSRATSWSPGLGLAAGGFWSKHGVAMLNTEGFTLRALSYWLNTSRAVPPDRRRTPQRVLAAMKAWYREAGRTAAVERAAQSPVYSATSPLKIGPVSPLIDGIKAMQLLTVSELHVEGRAMDHCIASLAQDAVQGRSYFYHAVIDGADLTIAIERVLGKWSVTECVGINNRKLSDRELRIVHGWAAAILH